jgi:ribonuclease HI
MKKVEIYTDGACKNNPGPGGYAAILLYNGKEKIVGGGCPQTTNNKMELTAVIEGLKALKEPCEADVFTDSKYVCDSVNLGWVYGWKKKGWMRSNKEKAQNVELWEELLSLLAVHKVRFHWIRGHSDHPYNERCDQLAVSFAEQAKASQDFTKS